MLIKDFLECANKNTNINVYHPTKDENGDDFFEFIVVGTPETPDKFKGILNSKIAYFTAVDHATMCVYIE
jgi:hypothetical protein